MVKLSLKEKFAFKFIFSEKRFIKDGMEDFYLSELIMEDCKE